MNRNLNTKYHKNIRVYCKEAKAVFQVTPTGKVYYIGKHGEIRRADSLRMRTGRILISHNGWNITLTGFDPKKQEFTYEAKKKEPEDG